MSVKRPAFLSTTRVFVAMLVTMVLCYAVVIALPHDPSLRYQSFKDTIFARLGYIYDRVHHDPAPIDVLFLGSSRTEVSMRPTMIEPALRQRGVSAHVANFALASTGFDIRETLAEDVLSNKRVKLLVIDVNEVFPRDGHQAFGDLATTGQLLRAPWLVNRNLPKNLLRLPVRQIDLALATLAPGANGYRAGFDPAQYPGTTYDPPPSRPEQSYAYLGTPAHVARLEAQSQRRYREMTPPVLPKSLEWVEFGVSQTYIERVVTMAQRRGVKVVFLFIPYYKGPLAPREEAWLRRFGPVWKADFLSGDPTYYRDSGHTNADLRTREAVTAWISDRIAASLSPSR